jgi:hypothetical protein
MATRRELGGYVERLSSTCVRLIATSTELRRLQQLLDDLTNRYRSGETLTILKNGENFTEPALLSSVGRFYKVSNKALKRLTASDASQSQELTPEDGATDIVDRVSLSASVGWDGAAHHTSCYIYGVFKDDRTMPEIVKIDPFLQL